MAHRSIFLFLFALLVPIFAVPSAADESPVWATLEAGEEGFVREVVDGDTLILTSGTVVRLVGIQAPKLPIGRKGFKAWPLSAESRAALVALVGGKRVQLYFGGVQRDRHGRALAHVVRPEKHGDIWAQGEMLKSGYARVYSFADNRALVKEMLELEESARQRSTGIWGNYFYGVKRATRIDDLRGGYQIVEGRVREVAVVKRRAYLNFGGDWRTDFTVSISPTVRQLFEREGHDLASLNGKKIRVRGWVKRRNGPMIEVTHPDQIVPLSEKEDPQLDAPEHANANSSPR